MLSKRFSTYVLHSGWKSVRVYQLTPPTIASVRSEPRCDITGMCMQAVLFVAVGQPTLGLSQTTSGKMLSDSLMLQRSKNILRFQTATTGDEPQFEYLYGALVGAILASCVPSTTPRVCRTESTPWMAVGVLLDEPPSGLHYARTPHHPTD
jgi:hypothetical protein